MSADIIPLPVDMRTAMARTGAARRRAKGIRRRLIHAMPRDLRVDELLVALVHCQERLDQIDDALLIIEQDRRFGPS